jgi:pullulanase
MNGPRFPVIGMVVMFLATALGIAPVSVAPPPRDPAKLGAAQLLVVHYARIDGQYDGWNLWAWPADRDGASFAFGDRDDFGRIAVVPLKERTDRVGLIVRKGDWEQKDGDQDRYVKLGDRPVTEVWLVAGDPRVHESRPTVDRSLKVHVAFLDARDRVMLATSAPLDAKQSRGLAVRLDGPGAPVRATAVKAAQAPGASRPLTEVRLSRRLQDDEVGRLRLEVPGSAPVPVFARDVLNDPAFVPDRAKLGAWCTRESTVFRTWSPVAERVELLTWAPGAAPDAPPARTVPLARGANGAWEAAVEGNLHGVPYRYRFHHYGTASEAADIHCFAATPDTVRSIAVDLSRCEPAGWADDRAPTVAKPTDEVIYELHVRDFTVADESCPPDRRGTYLGLVHSGTASGEATALGHLRELGVTAVHLLPVHDHPTPADQYNWGYWTAFFNVPEGNYATRAGDFAAPITELREAIAGLHRAGLRVVLDVVYNHTCSSGPSSPFDCTVPYWFFRTTPDGLYANDAGCGNSVADERPMVRKYILDSLSHWLTAYKVDGFRFDLLGTHVRDTVSAAAATIKRIRPDATIYGEPWTGGGPVRFGKGAQRGMPVAVFNDHLRNAIRGDLDGTATGFAFGPGGDREAVKRGIMGSIDDFAAEPAESVNYASAHDNLSLVDKIAKAAPGADSAARRAMQRLAIGIVLVSQGVPFIEGGSEICRTKGGDHNSYQSGDAANRFDWELKAGCDDVSDWVAGMIAIRRAHPAFRMADDAQVRAAIRWVDAPDEALAWTIAGAPSGDPAKRVFVALNGGPAPVTIAVPPGRWRVLADAARAGPEPRDALGSSVTVPPYAMVVAAE